MDTLDWALICELSGNSRMTYQALAKKFSLSPNTVKNRINRLLKQRVIKEFGVVLSMEMLGAEHVAGIVTTEGSEKVIEFMEQIAAQPMVCEIYRTSDRRYEYWAIVTGARETLGLKRVLNDLDGVIDVQMRPIEFIFPNKPHSFYLNTRGKKVTFTQHQLRVLKCLIPNSRIPVSQIAKHTGLTPNRVRRVIRDLQEGCGVHFCISYDVFALGEMEYRLRIVYDEVRKTGEELIRAIHSDHPDRFWWASMTTNEPSIDVGLLIRSPGEGIPILRKLEANPVVQQVEDFVSFPRVVRTSFPISDQLLELISEAGL